MPKYEILPNGYLKLTATPDEFEDKETLEDLLEPLLCNSELDWVQPIETGDLTDAPMLGIIGQPIAHEPNRDGYVLSGHWDDKTWSSPILQRWAWMHYQVLDIFEVLREKGEAVLEGGNLVEIPTETPAEASA